MTEDEATKKWCPMVRAGNEAGCNRNGPPIINGRQVTITHCIASECMWWTWEYDLEVSEDSNSLGYCEEKLVRSKTKGYCGACK